MFTSISSDKNRYFRDRNKINVFTAGTILPRMSLHSPIIEFLHKRMDVGMSAILVV
jgi:hypothetical protein